MCVCRKLWNPIINSFFVLIITRVWDNYLTKTEYITELIIHTKLETTKTSDQTQLKYGPFRVQNKLKKKSE